MTGCTRWLGWIAKTIMMSLLCAGIASPVVAGSVDPESWVKSDLVAVRDGRLVYDHHSLCVMRDAAAKPSERVLVHIEATFSDRLAGTTSKHAETWPEAFRP
jgi:hypothetical protein